MKIIIPITYHNNDREIYPGTIDCNSISEMFDGHCLPCRFCGQDYDSGNVIVIDDFNIPNAGHNCPAFMICSHCIDHLQAWGDYYYLTLVQLYQQMSHVLNTDVAREIIFLRLII